VNGPTNDKAAPPDAAAPLAGLRVVELARILAGPWAGQVLADLGADVIKVESPEGDDTRNWGPPFVEYADGGRDAAYFHSCNHGKRSVVADLTTPAGAALAKELCAGADVVIENFRRGGLARFGLDATTLRARRPRLIYCSITGFGQDGPLADRPGYDFVVQAMGGIMDLTGEPAGAPQKPGVAYADLFTGLHAVIAIEAALLRRERTGQGATIDLALLDTQVSMLANQAMNYLVSGSTPHRLGNAHPNLVPYQVFTVADGELVIAVGNDKQFRRLVEVLGVPGLADDPAMRTNADRVAHRTRVVAAVQAACLVFTRQALAEQLNRAGVPAGPIQTVAEVFADPQVGARELRTQVRSRDGESVPAVRTPIRIDGQPAPIRRAAPRLGEHQVEIERERATAPDTTYGGTGPNPTE
jgi:crotonobetainyl-CoA:carnitine CoA-transferase CaiB-like acyl-CoA transferase